MLKAAGREKEGLLDRESIETFPSEDLRTIDQLWVKYSNGHFGFSVQKRIWESVVGNQNTDTETSGHHRFEAHIGEDVNQYGDSLRDSFASRVGWRVQGEWLYYRDLTFNICAPEGHLPSPSFATPCLGREEEEHGVLGRWCAAFCFGSLRCGVRVFRVVVSSGAPILVVSQKSKIKMTQNFCLLTYLPFQIFFRNPSLLREGRAHPLPKF